MSPYDSACLRCHFEALETFYKARKNESFEFDAAILSHLMRWESLYEKVLTWIDNHSHKRVENMFFDGHAQEFYAAFGKEKVLKALSNPNAVLINRKKRETSYMLHLAAKTDNAFLVSYLLKRGADPHVRDNYWITPIAAAYQDGEKTKALEAFRAAGFDVEDPIYHNPRFDKPLAYID